MTINPVDPSPPVQTELPGRIILALKRLSINCASVSLSITKPISVLSNVERGSKLKEPINTVLPSMLKVLACRLAPELPVMPRSCNVLLCSRVGLSSYNSTPSRSYFLRQRAYPAWTTATSLAARELVRIAIFTPFLTIRKSCATPARVGTK